MLLSMIRAFAAALLVLGACGPAATSPSQSPTAAASVTATPSPAPISTATSGPTATPIALPATAQIAAAGGGVVWTLVGGTRLFVSADRGTTWQERALPGGTQTLEIAFVDDRVGWLMQAGSAATQCQSQGVLFWHTTDGAATWERWLEVRFDSSQDASGMSAAQCKSDLAFVDALRGSVSAYDPNSAPTIYRTSDSGKTWRGSRLPDPPGFTSGPGGFALRAGPVASLGTVSLVSAVGTTAGAATRYVFRSSDGGASWSFVSRAPDAQSAVVFLTPLRWLQIIPAGGSQETSDGGGTWHAFASDYAQAAPVAPQVAFGDAGTGYATVRGSIQRTTDGGAHWVPLRTPGT